MAFKSSGSQLAAWILLLVACSSAAGASGYQTPNRPKIDEKQKTDSAKEDPSIVFDEPFRTIHGLTTENGTAFDEASLTINGCKKLILPEDATVRKDGPPGKLQIYMAKTLSYAGHPPKPISIRESRKNMGCAVKSEKESVSIATFGEWDTHIEGGARMKLLFVVPKGMDVEKRKGLSGEESIARESRVRPLSKKKDTEGQVQVTPDASWKIIETKPDVKHTAK